MGPSPDSRSEHGFLIAAATSVRPLRAVVHRTLVSLLRDQYQRPMDLTERLWCHDLRWLVGGGEFMTRMSC
jgi:hypothetical protein